MVSTPVAASGGWLHFSQMFLMRVNGDKFCLMRSSNVHSRDLSEPTILISPFQFCVSSLYPSRCSCPVLANCLPHLLLQGGQLGSVFKLLYFFILINICSHKPISLIDVVHMNPHDCTWNTSLWGTCIYLVNGELNCSREILYIKHQVFVYTPVDLPTGIHVHVLFVYVRCCLKVFIFRFIYFSSERERERERGKKKKKKKNGITCISLSSFVIFSSFA